MKIGIIAYKVPPYICGIGDHSLELAKSIRSEKNLSLIIANKGDGSKHIKIYNFDWFYKNPNLIFDEIRTLKLDHLVLQFTPLYFFENNNYNKNCLLHFWKKCNKYMKTSIIIHETYFQDIRHPLSLIKGLFQKKLIKDLVKKSDFTFSSSPYLLDDINEWNLGAKTYYLPIGSNIPLIKINKVNKRKEKKIKKNEIVLTIFG